MQAPDYCGNCGGRLEQPAGGHSYCSTCERITYLDPKLAAACVVVSNGKVLLVRRAIEPQLGRWSFPSGYVNRGERVEHAAAREVQEETRLEVRTNWLVGLYSRADNPVVLAVYDAAIVGGKMEAGDETLDVGMFDIDDLPELAFEHDGRILEDWLAERRRRGASTT
jgi:ADP-ribose pyrophosphatase YjhB (NUDIX family)